MRSGVVPSDVRPWNKSSQPGFRKRLEGCYEEGSIHNRVHMWGRRRHDLHHFAQRLKVTSRSPAGRQLELMDEVREIT